jgi:PKD-like domain
MKLNLLLTTLFLSAVSWGQSIWTNEINGKNPGLTNPYTTGQSVDGNIIVSGIGRGTGTTTAFVANDRYNSVGWSSATKIDLNKYLEFTVTPKPGYEINFESFVYTGQVSTKIPNFAFRSSLDNYTTNIGAATAEGTTIPLAAATYQKISKAITFRFYVYNAHNGSTSYSINDFTFNGTVLANTMTAISTTNATLNIGESTELVASSVNKNYTYRWSPAKGLSATTGARVTAKPTASTIFTVTGTDAVLGTSSSKSIAVNVNAAPPCVGGSGTITAATICGNVPYQQTATSTTGATSESTTYVGNTSIVIKFPSLPRGAVVTKISTTITYTANNSSWLSALRVRVTPPNTSVLANPLIAFASDLRPLPLINKPETLTNSFFGGWLPGNPVGDWLFQFKQFSTSPGSPDATIDSITITVNYTSATIEWYTAATGGTAIGTGSPFNPVGVPGSGLLDTNTAGTTTFYAACSGNPSVRTASNFVINPTPVITNMTAASCSLDSFIAAPVNGTDGVVPVGTTYSWPLPVVTGGLVGGASATAAASITGALTNTTNTPQTATYTVTPTTGTCTGNTFTVTVTVNPTSVGGIVAGGTTISSGSVSDLLTLAGHTGTILRWESATSPFSTWSPIVNTTSTYTSGALTQTTQFRAVVQSGNCLIANSQAATVTVYDLPAAPSITIIQPSCAVPTGTITITPVAGETYSFDGGGYSSTLQYSELAQGSSHTIYAQNSLGSISLVTNATITPLATNIWTTSWSLGTPTIDQNIDFQGDYSSSGSINGCSCRVSSGNVVINSGDTMTITNGVTTVAGANLTFENTASLVQTNDAANNSGNITYKRNTQAMLRYDFTYWGKH